VQAALRARGLRQVLIGENDRQTDEPRIAIDNFAIGRAMTEHLIGLGHEEIGFIGGLWSTSAMRREGYRAALHAAGLPIRPELEQEGDFSFERGEQAARVLLAAKRRPSAIFAVNDATARGVLVAAQKLGLRVPDDLSVAGVDDAPDAVEVWPQLTTMHVPVEVMGEEAVELLLQGETLTAEHSTVLPFELRERGSTAPLDGRPPVA
jgi:LacI family transcriptional regulator